LTKNELIRWLEKYVEVAKRERTILEAKDKIENQIAYSKEALVIGEFGTGAKTVFIGCACMMMIVILLLILRVSAKTMAIVGLSGIAVLIVIGIPLIIADTVNIKNKRKEAEKAIPQLEKQRDKLDNQITDILMDLSILDQQDVLDEKYMNYQAASRFLEYLRTGRADTLKEAMNLYENERFQERMYRENQRHHRQMEDEQLRQTEELKRARQEAERAAETAEQAAKQAHRDSQFNLIAGAVIADAAIKEERQRNETPGMHI